MNQYEHTILSIPTDWAAVAIGSISILALLISVYFNYRSVRLATNVSVSSERQKLIFSSVTSQFSKIVEMNFDEMNEVKFSTAKSLLRVMLDTKETSAAVVIGALNSEKVVTIEDFESWKEAFVVAFEVYIDAVYRENKI